MKSSLRSCHANGCDGPDGFVQGVRKVTPGTPGDNQLSVYCSEADVFVSGDSTFVDITDRVRRDAPAPVAEAHVLQRDDAPLEAIVNPWA
jgi:hypothetical protein